jgi:hypothetical protein
MISAVKPDEPASNFQQRDNAETPNVWVRGANGRRVSRGRFRVVGCGAFRLDFDGGLGGEAEETALFLPVMRQVFAQSQQPGRRQLNRMSTCE